MEEGLVLGSTREADNSIYNNKVSSNSTSGAAAEDLEEGDVVGEITDRGVEAGREGDLTATTGEETMEATTEEASMAPATVWHLGVGRTMAMTSTMITKNSISRTRWGTWSGSMSGCRKSTRTWGMEAMAGMMEVTGEGEATTRPEVGEETTLGVEGVFGATEAEEY